MVGYLLLLLSLFDSSQSAPAAAKTTTSTTLSTSTTPFPTTTTTKAPTTFSVSTCDAKNYGCNVGYCPKKEQIESSCSCKKCKCPTYDQTGQFCQLFAPSCDPCQKWFFSSPPCPSNYECDSSTGVKKCNKKTCDSGLTGDNCEFVVGNLCESYPCINGGVCTGEKTELSISVFSLPKKIQVPLTDYSCDCPDGYEGKQCQLKSPCEGVTCQNRGKCITVLDKTVGVCQCKNNWLGKSCEEPNRLHNERQCTSTSCGNEKTGYCLEEANGFSCVCRPGTSGKYCQTTLTPCTTFGCLNGATCVPTEDSSTARCICPSGFSGPKCADKDHCFFTPCQNRATCVHNTSTALGYNCLCLPKYYGDNCENFKACSSSPCAHGGTCKEVGGKYYDCTCKAAWEGRDCDEDVDECAVAASTGTVLCEYGGTCRNTIGSYECACINGTEGFDCSINPDNCNMTYVGPNGRNYKNLCNYLDPYARCEDGFDTYTCNCSIGYFGEHCMDIDECFNAAAKNVTLCENFGNCVNTIGSYKCECINGTYGFNCSENPNDCEFNYDYTNGVIYGEEKKCIAIDNGANCTDGIGTYTCSCTPQWTGEHCTEDVDECSFDTPPCVNFGTCINTLGGYECQCIKGTEGKNCEINPDDCVNVTKCNSVDPNANCTDGFDTYTCTCSPDYTMEYCDLEMIIYKVLQLIGGGGASEYDLIAMLRDLLRNPSMMKDLVPFMIGLQSEKNRTKMSWDVEDFFLWIAYEERTVDLTKDIVKWNDVVLGNCFTFNHFNNSNRMFRMRSDGAQGGLKAAVRLNTPEYLPWTETSGIMTFIHPNTELIFSESPRYNAMPHAQTTIQSKESRFKRLGGKYGKCVKSKEQVDSYYYDGSYTTDGCLRSCYQDEVKKACKCMDSRYPMAGGEIACELPDRKCVESITAKGDVSTWAGCSCPLPCENSQFVSSYTVVPFVRSRNKCNTYTAAQRKNNSACDDLNAQVDYAIINVQVPRIMIDIFEETPAWTFNKVIGTIGGLGGVVCGLNLLSFFEFGIFFFFQLPMTLIFNREY